MKSWKKSCLNVIPQKKPHYIRKRLWKKLCASRAKSITDFCQNSYQNFSIWWLRKKDTLYPIKSNFTICFKFQIQPAFLQEEQNLQPSMNPVEMRRKARSLSSRATTASVQEWVLTLFVLELKVYLKNIFGLLLFSVI